MPKGLIKLTAVANRIEAEKDYYKLLNLARKYGLSVHTPELRVGISWKKIDERARYAAWRIITRQPNRRGEIEAIYPGISFDGLAAPQETEDRPLHRERDRPKDVSIRQWNQLIDFLCLWLHVPATIRSLERDLYEAVSQADGLWLSELTPLY